MSNKRYEVMPYTIVNGVKLWAVEREDGYILKYCNTKEEAEEYKSNYEQDKEILSCPHCGNEECILMPSYTPHLKLHSHRVWCTSCQCRTGPEKTAKKAIQAWNRRKYSAN